MRRPGPVLLQIRDVTMRFGAVRVLHGVSLRVRGGEVVALVGETGAGKSSLVSCIAGVLEPEAGEMVLEDAPLPPSPRLVRRAGLEVVWQDHGLCDDLDIVANVVLGREGGFLGRRGSQRDEAIAALRRVGADHLPVDRPVRALSRGQKQLVAVARALLAHPKVLVLDEPTASLGVTESARVQDVVAEARRRGAGVLLVSHDLEQVFGLADRIVVLRQGRVVADVTPTEVPRADLVALMSGIEMDSTAHRQLHRLRSLVDQLSDIEPAATLPLIVSAMAAALEQEMLCVHLLDTTGDEVALQRSAAVGLPAPMLDVNERLPIGGEGACAGLAAETGDVVVVDDLSAHPAPAGYATAAARSGIQSEWAAPLVGTRGVLGTVTGYGTSVGRPDAERLELARLYLGYAAGAVERERLLEEVSRRNRVLEAVRAMLDTLAGPDRVEGGLAAALLSLSRGLGAAAVGALVEQDDDVTFHVASDAGDHVGAETTSKLRWAASQLLADADAAGEPGDARLVADDIAAVILRMPQRRASLVAHLPATASVADTLELLDDASRSLALAMEAEALESAQRETAALRRSHAIQRELLWSLSHELRTPLTAIQGYASTLCQPDLTWDEASTDRFLHSIASESARLERLVGDLLDSTAIESGSLRLSPDWCDVRLVVEAATGCVHDSASVRIHVDDDLEPVWADHDRLEQVIVNLVENAVTHGHSDDGVDVTARRGSEGSTVEIEVRDHGAGITPAVADRIFEPQVRGTSEVAGAGLGLAIARGIVRAHGGRLEVVSAGPGATFVVTLPTEPAEGAEWSVVSATEEHHVV
jgi:signal transduction histidine kinase/ABC-type branched-subunit amino acid transport system ATPase component